MEISRATNGRQTDSDETSYNPQNKTKLGTPTIKTEGSAHITRERYRPRLAESMKMIILTFPMNIYKNPSLIRQFRAH
jgi:hypothetical protein